MGKEVAACQTPEDANLHADLRTEKLRKGTQQGGYQRDASIEAHTGPEASSSLTREHCRSYNDILMILSRILNPGKVFDQDPVVKSRTGPESKVSGGAALQQL